MLVSAALSAVNAAVETAAVRMGLQEDQEDPLEDPVSALALDRSRLVCTGHLKMYNLMFDHL